MHTLSIILLPLRICSNQTDIWYNTAVQEKMYEYSCLLLTLVLNREGLEVRFEFFCAAVREGKCAMMQNIEFNWGGLSKIQ